MEKSSTLSVGLDVHRVLHSLRRAPTLTQLIAGQKRK
jgi:hypothetical protein